MKLIELIPDLVNFYILLPAGKLGAYDPNGQFLVHNEFTESFGENIQALLDNCKADPEIDNYRIAIVYPTSEGKPWHTATLALETHILRKFYPVQGDNVTSELTSFQKKNIEKSIYQGFELFLDYKDPTLPDTQPYCPVLFFRQTTLDQYLHLLNRDETPGDKQTPVVEVLNFLAPIHQGRRLGPAIIELTHTIEHGVINKGVRGSPYNFLREAQHGVTVIEKKKAGEGPGAIDGGSDPGSPENKESYDDWIKSHCEPGTYEHVKGMLTDPCQYIEHEDLRPFTRFKGLSVDGLSLLASRHPLFKAVAGTRILDHGSNDDWSLYLVAGTLQLQAADGATKTVEGGTAAAANPVASLKPRMYSITAMTPVTFLWMYDPMVDSVIKIDQENNPLVIDSGIDPPRP